MCYHRRVNEILVGTALAVLVALIFAGLFPGTKPESRRARPATVISPLKTCPLCGSQLELGERVHSEVFVSDSGDKSMEIVGCPHCRPPSSLQRQCPVCKKELRPQDVVAARVFERKNETGSRKTHVHVLGCPHCRRYSK